MVNWLKQIQGPGVTSTDTFAGDVMNWVIQYHSDIDLAAGDPQGIVKVATETIFGSNKLKMYDSNKSHTVNVTVPDFVEDKTLNIPTTMPQADDLMTRTAVQTTTNKTVNVDQNVIKHSTTNAAGDLLVGNASQFIRLPRGTAGQFLQVNPGGTDVIWGAGGGGGGGNVSTTASNTYGDFDQIFRSGRLDVRNPADTFSYSIAGGAITGANRIVTLPLLTADDTFVTQAFAQTLTNKIIEVDTNTLRSTTNGIGDLLRGDGSKFVRFPRGTSNQVLTMNAGGTDFAWANPASGGGNVSTGSANTYTAGFDQLFQSGNLDLRNPGNTFQYSFVASAIAANRNVTLPLLTADDTFVTEAFAQPLTNKTIAAGSNTISGIADANIATHTTTKISTTTKALLNTAIIYNDQNNDLGAFYNDIDQITTPANPASGSRRLFADSGNGAHLSVRTSGGATVDLENGWVPDSIRSGNQWGLWSGGAKGGTGMFSVCGYLLAANTNTFQGTAASVDKVTTEFNTAATTGSQAGFLGTSAATTGGYFVCLSQNPRFKCSFYFDALTNKRFAFGFLGANTVPASDTFLATAIPGFIFRYSSTTDTALQLFRNTNSGTATQVNTGLTVAANTKITIEIVGDSANSRWGWAVNEGAFTYYTTAIPTASQYLNYAFQMEAKTAAIQRVRMYYCYLIQDGV